MFIGSVEQVEIICLLSAEPLKSWSVQDVFRVIQSSSQSVASRLEEFCGQGLFVRESNGNYRYSPKNAELAQAVAELAKAYQERRVRVVEMIYRRSPDTLRDFANAFKLRKEK